MDEKNENSKNELNEPSVSYGNLKQITFFNSHEEQELFHIQQMANRSPEESMKVLEQLRRIVFKEYLLPDGNWKPIEKVITFKKPFL